MRNIELQSESVFISYILQSKLGKELQRRRRKAIFNSRNLLKDNYSYQNYCYRRVEDQWCESSTAGGRV